MATFRVDGLEALNSAFADIASFSDEAIDAMLDAEADIVVAAQKQTAESMLQGPYNKGAVAASITKGPIKPTNDGRSMEIQFVGTQHGEQLARIAYINEYGKTNQPARPFIKTANEQCAGAALKAASDAYDRYLKSKNL